MSLFSIQKKYISVQKFFVSILLDNVKVVFTHFLSLSGFQKAISVSHAYPITALVAWPFAISNIVSVLVGFYYSNLIPTIH